MSISKKIDWSKVNWQEQDIVIAGQLNITRERIRQKRREIHDLILNKHAELSLLLDNRDANLKALKAERTEYQAHELRDISRQVAGWRQKMEAKEEGAADHYATAMAKRGELRLRIKDIRWKIRLLENHEELHRLLTLKPEDMAPVFWHRPKDTHDVVSALTSLKVEEMTRKEIQARLKQKGIIRGFSWISTMLKDLNRTCLRARARRKTKYAWDKITVKQYQTLTDREIAARLKCENPSVVTQWRTARGLRKMKTVRSRRLQAAEKEHVGNGNGSQVSSAV